MSHDPEFVYARNNLALAYLCESETEKAVSITEDILKKHPDNVHAICNMTILTKRMADERYSFYLERVKKLSDYSIEELQKKCLTLCEVGEHALAATALMEYLSVKPYDKKFMHYYAVSLVNINQKEKSKTIWLDILKIDPDDTIAKYYLKAVSEGEPGVLSYIYQVPVDEITRRISFLNDCMRYPQDVQQRLWKENEEYLSLLLWGLEQGDDYIKHAILDIISTFKDDQAEDVLRSFILRRNEPDDVKNEIFFTLKRMGAPEPYTAYLNGAVVNVKVGLFKSELSMTPAYKRVLELLIEKADGPASDGFINSILKMWQKFISHFSGKIAAHHQTAGSVGGGDGIYFQKRTDGRGRAVRKVWCAAKGDAHQICLFERYGSIR